MQLPRINGAGGYLWLAGAQQEDADSATLHLNEKEKKTLYVIGTPNQQWKKNRMFNEQGTCFESLKTAEDVRIL